MAACGMGSGGLSGDDLAEAIGQLDALESLQQELMLTQATLDEINQAIACLGKGMCQGLGCYGPWQEGPVEGYGPGTGGPGRGFGPRKSDTEGQTDSKSTRVQSHAESGPIIASWYFKGSQVKGDTQLDFSEVVQAARDNAAEAVNENEIPRKYEKAVKKYFGELEEARGP